MTDNIRKLADRNGLYVAMDILQEECAELIQAVSKHRRKISFSSCVNLAEEIADVEIMIEQIKYLLDNDDLIRNWKDIKVRRQMEREGIHE